MKFFCNPFICFFFCYRYLSLTFCATSPSSYNTPRRNCIFISTRLMPK
nr:MAG TPA: hypothetical protein [Siphoviridae sp. ctngg6]